MSVKWSCARRWLPEMKTMATVGAKNLISLLSWLLSPRCLFPSLLPSLSLLSACGNCFQFSLFDKWWHFRCGRNPGHQQDFNNMSASWGCVCVCWCHEVLSTISLYVRQRLVVVYDMPVCSSSLPCRTLWETHTHREREKEFLCWPTLRMACE